MQSFESAFASIGYEKCANWRYEAGFEKVAIYTKGGAPTHAARQLTDGTWTSKLGKHDDINHPLNGVNGAGYGAPAAFMRRPV